MGAVAAKSLTTMVSVGDAIADTIRDLPRVEKIRVYLDTYYPTITKDDYGQCIGVIYKRSGTNGTLYFKQLARPFNPDKTRNPWKYVPAYASVDDLYHKRNPHIYPFDR